MCLFNVCINTNYTNKVVDKQRVATIAVMKVGVVVPTREHCGICHYSMTDP